MKYLAIIIVVFVISCAPAPIENGISVEGIVHSARKAVVGRSCLTVWYYSGPGNNSKHSVDIYVSNEVYETYDVGDNIPLIYDPKIPEHVELDDTKLSK